MMGTDKHAQAEKIDFGKKTPKARIQDLPHHQMRIIISQDGRILHANDAFAAHLGIPPIDLKDRNFLDSILFENFDDLVDDRAIFNNLGHDRASPIASLREGEHTIILGKDHDHIPFYFSWVTSQDHRNYLVAHSLDTQTIQTPDWASLIASLIPSNTSKKQHTAPLKKETQTPQSLRPILKKASGRPVHKISNLTSDDVEKFIRINRDFMCLMEADGILIRENDSFIEAFKTKTHSFFDIIHEESRPSVRQALQALSTHDQEDGVDYSHIEFETRTLCHNETTLWVHWNIHKDGEYLYAVGHDISAAKANEKALIHREQELSEAQALANMGHWRWNVGSATIEWSDQIYDIFGVTREEFTPTLDNANDLLHKRDLGRMMQAFQRAIIEQNDYDMDFRVVRPDGSIRYIRCEGRCELDNDGDAIALYGVMQDITEQTEHEMELLEAKEAAEQAYAAKSRFLANMSHELRTPLNAIIGFSDMIQRQMLGPLGSEKYVDYATSIKDSGEHLLDLITDILDMSKIEAGKYELDLDKIQLGNVVNCAVRMIESRAQEGVLTLENKVESDDPVITADRRAIMQILLNILSNAVKFTEPGGTITVTCEENDNFVYVKVSDTGIGIPANKLNSVMRPFEQVSTEFTRNHEGSGLGLAITKELAELHGGSLTLESSVGQGTTATLKLPR